MQQTEGETDTGSDHSDNATVKITKKPTKGDSVEPDDSKSNDWDSNDARDMRRQLKHYITQSNIHDIGGFNPSMLNVSPSDLESAAEFVDKEERSGTMKLLFPTKTRGGGGGGTPSGASGVEAVTVRDKLDTVQTNVNDMIEKLQTSRKGIKDKRVLSLLDNLQSQLTSVQDGVEDADTELKTEERKYHSIQKQYERTNKEMEQLKLKQEREQRAAAEQKLKDQLNEQKQQTLKWQQLAMQGGPGPMTPQGNPTMNPASNLQAFVTPATPYGIASQISPRASAGPPPLNSTMVPSGNPNLNNNNASTTLNTAAPNTAVATAATSIVAGLNGMPNQLQQQQSHPNQLQQPVAMGMGAMGVMNTGALSPKNDQIQSSSPMFSSDTSNNANGNNNNGNANVNDPSMMPITSALGNSPLSPQGRGRNKNRSKNDARNNSRSLSRRTRRTHNYTSQSNESGGQMLPHITDDDSYDNSNNNHNERRRRHSGSGARRRNKRHSGHSHDSALIRGHSDPSAINAQIEIGGGHRSSNEMLEQVANELHGRSNVHHNHNHNHNHNHHSNSHHSNPQNRSYLQNMSPHAHGGHGGGQNIPISISSSSRNGNSVPNNANMDHLGPLSVGSSSQPQMQPNGIPMYASPQPGVLDYNIGHSIAQPSEGPGYHNAYDNMMNVGGIGGLNQQYPNVSYAVGYGNNGNINDSNHDLHQPQVPAFQAYQSDISNHMQSDSRPLISDTSIKIIAGVVVFATAAWILSKYLDSGRDSMGSSMVRRGPRGRL